MGKRFGSIPVLTDISLTVERGELFGLIGLNGAGKTTLIRCLVNLLRPTTGTITFNAHRLTPDDVLQQIGYLPEAFQPPLNLTASELLRCLGCSGTTSPETLLARVGLSAQRHRRVRTYSRGMVQRLGLAIALMKDPQLLILDEPFLGLDVVGQRDLLKLLRELNRLGKTVIFSSHGLFQVEQCAQRIGVLHQGTLRFAGPVPAFVRERRAGSLEEAFFTEVKTG